MLKKSKLEAYQVVEGEEGTYEPLDMVVQHEGGRHSAQAWEAALNYLQRCMELGGMWISYNDFTKRVEVLYIKRTRRSSFDQKWQLYEEAVLSRQSLPATILWLQPWLHLKRNVLPMLLLQATLLLPRNPNIKLPPLQLQRQPLMIKEVLAGKSLAKTRRTSSCFAPAKS